MILSKKTHGVSDNHIRVTRDYFSIVKSLLEGTKDEIILSNQARYLLQSDKEACMELYRHCLCLALNLDTKLSYRDLECLEKPVANRLRFLLSNLCITDKSDVYKKGFVEACMHCIVISRNSIRGDK